jgi:hypothetical protein
MPQRKHHVLALLIVLTSSVSAAPKADAVLEWNEVMLTTLIGQSPAEEMRLAAITQAAVFEAVNAVTHDYVPYLGTIEATPGASAEAAAIAAAHAVLRHYVADRSAELDAARVKSLHAVQGGPAKHAGVKVGEAAALAMIKRRENDGSQPPEFYKPNSSEPGAWRLTPNCSEQGGVFVHFRNLDPFGIKRPSQFRAPPPPPLTSKRYTMSYNEVKQVGGKHSTARPQDRADVAHFYAAVLALRTWNPVARQASIAQGRSLSENARAFALLNMAMTDAIVAVFDSKYEQPFWRPETAIRAADTDRNRFTQPDREFEPFIPTPCHPSFPSAHASAAHAALAVLERIYGRANHRLTLSSPAVPDVVLEYDAFERIAADIDDARIFGGIHFRFDQQAGARQGRRVGQYVYRHNLRPAHGSPTKGRAIAAQ